MKMPMNGGEGSRHVGFAPEPVYSRLPRVDEEYVMEHFHKHAKHCDDCHDPYKTYKKGGTLCDQGHRLAQDVAGYMYSKGGKAYSMLDRESLKQRVQVEIPPHCDKVRGLLQAVDHGLRVQKPGALKSQDKNYYVPTRPDRRSYHDDRHGGAVKEPRRRHEEERRYHDDRRYRSDPNYQRAERHRYPEKRQSMPSHYAPYGSVWETDPVERKYQQSYYDGNPVYYYKPSRGGKERRIPRSESPKCESTRRRLPEDYRSSRYGIPSSHRSSRYDYSDSSRPSRYNSPDVYRSSRYESPDSYRSSRHGSPKSYQSSWKTSPERYSSRRSSWSPERLYRELFR
ncbi:hypothetical protein EPUS_00691 [Endocarpon pusillum Z07020]|uniref:Uncharacterized protein n=1 Tax=Endocarpon pusillum (strain Z07020 / HMAS-L-300199) TaxID=1263415 RepID=U1GRF0_ENDPU|nr:uncharacterized protein EPUS_00691 [Endocarpon pusillum Z07020]ERF74561.1 hypothetical protein EPUS_00691 [Endocarpon pusillum Z07020]